MKNTILLLGYLIPLALAAQIPEPVLPAGVGVNIHFVKGHERDLDLIAAAGFKFVRMDFTWAGIERKRGEYDWSGYDELTANLEKRGIRALYILDYSNPLYEAEVTSKNPISGQQHKTTASPQHPESVTAFAKWAGAAAKRFSGRGILWEIWNEPNIHFWQPEPNVEQYITLARATANAIREADPRAMIVGPAISGFDPPFMEKYLASGALEYLDAVSVHPYRDYKRPPESAAADYAKLRELIERHAPAARKSKIPILSGEWGYATHTKGISLEIQADFAARQQLANLLHGVPLSIWYDWKNDGNDPDEREHNFGTVWPDLKPKPAYLAIQTLTRELNGYRIARRQDTGSASDFVLVLTNAAGETKLAAWTLGEAKEITLDVSPKSSGSVSIVEGLGERSEAKLHEGRLTVRLSAMPQYLTLGMAALVKDAVR
ncbi:MAG: cellulase family glycosylhydrolase [Verrucomicrobia bacterium]|nr:cellulase family glycosylhydrolase [Verrucomicrobiota bacterium]